MAPSVDTATSTSAVSAIPVKKVVKSASGPTLRKRKSLNASNASDASLSSNLSEVELLEKTYLWGCELSRSNDAFVAKYPIMGELDYPEHHQLVIKGATLGLDAKEKERNVVEVRFQNASGEEQRFTIASLTLGAMETCRLDLSMSWAEERDLTFKLIKGSGPVSLLGNHIVTPSPDADSLFVPDPADLATTEGETEESGMSTDGDEIDAMEVKDLETDKDTPATDK